MAFAKKFRPLGLSFWRTLLGFLVILPIFMRPLRLQADLVRRNWRILSLLAFLLIIAGNAMLYLSLQYTVVINVVVLNSAEPIMIIAIAWLIFRDPVTYRQTFGIAVSMFGVLFLISSGDVTKLAGLHLNKGDLLVLFAYLNWSVYAVLLRRAPAGLDPRVLIVVLLGFGSLFGLPIFLLEHFAFRPMPFDWVSVLSIVGARADQLRCRGFSVEQSGPALWPGPRWSVYAPHSRLWRRDGHRVFGGNVPSLSHDRHLPDRHRDLLQHVRTKP